MAPTNRSGRRMHLLAYLKTGPTATHVGGWRHPEAVLDDILEPSRYEHIARVLEAAKFDGCFFADLFGLYDIHKGGFDTYIERGGQISFLDPMMVLPMMARVTTRLGLGTTLSTTFHNPYNLARMLGSLDLLSKGRVAWNVVTSATDLEAKNFGLEEIPPRDERYDRADEFLEACCALWDGWQPDPFVFDKAQGILADPSKIRYANYQGKWIRTRGPLSIPRSPQGRPVIMQAGASGRGRDFAARWGEMIFCPFSDPAGMAAFTTDIRDRMDKYDRDPGDCVIMPSFRFVIGETDSIAAERAAYLDTLIDPELALAAGSSAVAVDLSRYKGDTPLADQQGNQGIQGSVDAIAARAAREKISFTEAARLRRDDIIGSPSTIADRLQALFETGACDGFLVQPNVAPIMHEQFARAVVPELQRRGLFRTEYAGTTLREHLRD